MNPRGLGDRLEPVALTGVVGMRHDRDHRLPAREQRLEGARAEAVVGEDRPARHAQRLASDGGAPAPRRPAARTAPPTPAPPGSRTPAAPAPPGRSVPRT